jgi:hypothetical protein
MLYARPFENHVSGFHASGIHVRQTFADAFHRFLIFLLLPVKVNGQHVIY